METNKKNIKIDSQKSIKNAMDFINKSGKGSVAVIDKKNKLLGIVTDGDIRRAILAGKKIEDKVLEITNLKPSKGNASASKTELLKIMEDKKINVLPIVDKKGIFKDLVLVRDLMKVSLSSPDITDKEIKAVNDVLTSNTLSIGPNVEKFERLFAEYIGTKYAIAVNSGTSGLHLCIRALDIKDDDEVITSPFSFIASANCAIFERAKPVFVDIDEKSLCMDASKIEAAITKKTKAILPVHIFGHPCDMQKIMQIAKKHNLAVIEDACESLGAEFKGKKVGGFGDASVFAFYPNKQITTTEGGMVVTNDERIAKLCRAMRNQGRTNSQWLSHEILGYNYRMGELNAALGAVQIQRVKEILKKREKVAGYYNKHLKNFNLLTVPQHYNNIDMSWFVYVVRLNNKNFSKTDRDEIINELNSLGISCKNYFPPIHLEPLYVKMFGYKKGVFPIAESVSETTIALPFYNNLSEEKVSHISKTLKSVVDKYLKKDIKKV